MLLVVVSLLSFCVPSLAADGSYANSLPKKRILTRELMRTNTQGVNEIRRVELKIDKTLELLKRLQAKELDLRNEVRSENSNAGKAFRDGAGNALGKSRERAIKSSSVSVEAAERRLAGLISTNRIRPSAKVEAEIERVRAEIRTQKSQLQALDADRMDKELRFEKAKAQIQYTETNAKKAAAHARSNAKRAALANSKLINDAIAVQRRKLKRYTVDLRTTAARFRKKIENKKKEIKRMKLAGTIPRETHINGVVLEYFSTVERDAVKQARALKAASLVARDSPLAKKKPKEFIQTIVIKGSAQLGVFQNPETLFGSVPKLAADCAREAKTAEAAFWACAELPKTLQPSQEDIEVAFCVKSSQSSAAAVGCVVPATTNNACIKDSIQSEEKLLECMLNDVGEKDPNVKRIIAAAQCFESAGKDSGEFAECIAPRVLNKEAAKAWKCFKKSKSSAAGLACAAGANEELIIAVNCAVATGGQPHATATCIGSKLLEREIGKCFSEGFGGDGCFGKNNFLRKLTDEVKALSSRAFGKNSLVSVLVTGVIDNVLMPGKNHELVKLFNSGIFATRNLSARLATAATDVAKVGARLLAETTKLIDDAGKKIAETAAAVVAVAVKVVEQVGAEVTKAKRNIDKALTKAREDLSRELDTANKNINNAISKALDDAKKEVERFRKKTQIVYIKVW